MNRISQIFFYVLLAIKVDAQSIDRIEAISDAWCPEINLWIGYYPYLLRPAFEEFVNRKILN